MALIVQKYGGTSVGSTDKIKHVAQNILKARQQGHDVVVVVSAMSGETNRLLSLAHDIQPDVQGRELDVLLSSGEQVSIALLSIALESLGQPSRSYLGHQVKILTDSVHNRARIRRIEGKQIFNALKKGKVVVVAGFQGITDDGQITTLGRGGSDTTAVALAAALNADRCEIYTDVDGVYTIDPRLYPKAIKLNQISYKEMLELSSLGAKVLETRSVMFGAQYDVNLVVKSTFQEGPGTMITNACDLENNHLLSGIVLSKNVFKLCLTYQDPQDLFHKDLFHELAKENISVDMLVQHYREDGLCEMQFTVTNENLEKTKDILLSLSHKTKNFDLAIHDHLAKISLVGLGISSNPRITSQVLNTITERGIDMDLLTTSETKLSFLTPSESGKEVVRLLHEELTWTFSEDVNQSLAAQELLEKENLKKQAKRSVA